MTAVKDMSRPTSQHRLSVGSNAATLPVRTSYSRSHSHTVSLGGSVNGSNRINRRKSSTFSPGTHPAMIGAALENAVAESSAASRRLSTSKAALGSSNDAGYPPVPSSLPHHVSVPEVSSESALLDGPALSTFQGIDKTKQRMRRASDGSRLTKKEKAATGDLKCEHCGKAYKHGSCLNKHLWEHTPQWQLTSKLLISKHQQVQLLEAASVLVAMNSTTSQGAQGAQNDSDNSSSPAASGSSERDDEPSSPESTPPPQTDTAYRESNSKRFSTTSSAYSRSYQSVFSESAPSNGEGTGFAHYRHWSSSSGGRPLTADPALAASYPDEDPQELAAAVGLLSCSYGTPKTGPTVIPGGSDDVPPVPPLPLKYVNAFAGYRAQEDVVMDDEEEDERESSDDEPLPPSLLSSRTGNEEFEGVFGKMDA